MSTHKLDFSKYVSVCKLVSNTFASGLKEKTVYSLTAAVSAVWRCQRCISMLPPEQQGSPVLFILFHNNRGLQLSIRFFSGQIDRKGKSQGHENIEKSPFHRLEIQVKPFPVIEQEFQHN